MLGQAEEGASVNDEEIQAQKIAQSEVESDEKIKAAAEVEQEVVKGQKGNEGAEESEAKQEETESTQPAHTASTEAYENAEEPLIAK